MPTYLANFYFSPRFQEGFKNKIEIEIQIYESSTTRVVDNVLSIMHAVYVFLSYDMKYSFVLGNLPEKVGKSKSWPGKQVVPIPPHSTFYFSSSGSQQSTDC